MRGDLYVLPDGRTSEVLTVRGGTWMVIDNIYGPYRHFPIPDDRYLYYIHDNEYTENNWLLLDVRSELDELENGRVIPFQLPLYSGDTVVQEEYYDQEQEPEEQEEQPDTDYDLDNYNTPDSDNN